ncbi:MAG: hypothetical protein C0168_02005 [Candidatus Aminicenantes bacterium]|nr:MAG: hypothetical protein C0168_02005 [Candidatus Aminicenantes bacterium]
MRNQLKPMNEQKSKPLSNLEEILKKEKLLRLRLTNKKIKMANLNLQQPYLGRLTTAETNFFNI